jgi:hypothetical protein
MTVRVYEDAQVTSYIDPATLRRDGHMRRVWTLQDLNKRSSFGTMSFRAYVEYDCSEARRRDLEFSSHNGPMATGEVIQSFSPPGNWRYVAPGTLVEAMLNFACC